MLKFKRWLETDEMEEEDITLVCNIFEDVFFYLFQIFFIISFTNIIGFHNLF